MSMSIYLQPQVAVDLATVASIVRDQEFSGFAYAEVTKDLLSVYDYVLLDVGSSGYTEIQVEDQLALAEREDRRNMVVWFHRHPVGNGIPGPHNWSGTDHKTIMETPLGSIPGLIQWSASIVLTPKGWVGRIDNYMTKQTIHVPVTGVARADIYPVAERLLWQYNQRRQQFLQAQEIADAQSRREAALALAGGDGFDIFDFDWEDDGLYLLADNQPNGTGEDQEQGDEVAGAKQYSLWDFERDVPWYRKKEEVSE